jgi:hypothetical protein
MGTTAIHAMYGLCGTGPKPPKSVAKYDAKPKNIAGIKLKTGRRAVHMRQVFNPKRIVICAITNDVPV